MHWYDYVFWLSRVVSVDAHVLIRQITSPGLTTAGPMPQAEANRNVLLPQDIAGCSAIKGQGLTGRHQLMRTYPKSNRIGIEGHA